MKNLYSSLFVALLTFLVVGCTKEKCVVCPPETPSTEKEYHLFYNDYFSGAVYTFNTKTGQIDDSVHTSWLWDCRFSRDGTYAFYSSDPPATWMTRVDTSDTLAILRGIETHWLSPTSDGKYLLVSGGALAILALPNFSTIFERVQGNAWDYGTVHPFKNIAYVPHSAEDSLLVIDFQGPVVVDRKVPLFLQNGTPMGAVDVGISRDGSILIVSGAPHLRLYDSESFTLLQEYVNGQGMPYVHPDGVRVFFLKWEEIDYWQEAEVWELNLRTFLMTRILRGEDFGPIGTGEPLDPSDMDFTPDGKYAFISNGGQGWKSGPILKMDCDTYKIVAVFPTPAGISGWVRVNPQEITVP